MEHICLEYASMSMSILPMQYRLNCAKILHIKNYLSKTFLFFPSFPPLSLCSFSFHFCISSDSIFEHHYLNNQNCCCRYKMLDVYFKKHFYWKFYFYTTFSAFQFILSLYIYVYGFGHNEISKIYWTPNVSIENMCFVQLYSDHFYPTKLLVVNIFADCYKNICQKIVNFVDVHFNTIVFGNRLLIK